MSTSQHPVITLPGRRIRFPFRAPHDPELRNRLAPKNRLHDRTETELWQELVRILQAMQTGDFSQRFSPIPEHGYWSTVARLLNDILKNQEVLALEISRICQAVTDEGQLRSRLTRGDYYHVTLASQNGAWKNLGDLLNLMLTHLRMGAEREREQEWFKTHLSRFSILLQGQQSVEAISQLILSELTPLVGAAVSTFYILEQDAQGPYLRLVASYGLASAAAPDQHFRLRQGLIGQCAYEKKRMLLCEVPSSYLTISSSLGQARPAAIVVLPVLYQGDVKAVIELASLQGFPESSLDFLDQLMDSIGVVFNMLASAMRTEELLEKLKNSNLELEKQAFELEEKAKLLEIRNQEVQLASFALEEKAEQLALISKYKSEFLANMSHELRTPLNSLLILSHMLAENRQQNLSPEQIKYASTIHAAGCDLLSLINEILDLSKVEAGKMPIHPSIFDLASVQELLEQTFRPVAEHKGLSFHIEVMPHTPETMFTDIHRLQQVLKNLLSNAFKFTTKGHVILSIQLAGAEVPEGLSTPCLRFSVRDTGIGIPKEKHKLIFEAFQQADGTTSRKFGGTGLGLTISREMARLLGGAIEVESIYGQGSIFHLYVPQHYAGHEVPPAFPQLNINTAGPLPLPTSANFKGRRILLVDDDMRNIYTMTCFLENYGMKVSFAENGRLAIEQLDAQPDFDLVLMDTMMPEMDGWEATRAIRRDIRFKNLPIISLTAKAMKGDREKCLTAGASDYITKPVDTEQLLALMHLWLQDKTSDQLSREQ